ncbi:MAG: hypothetical protein ACF787_02780 [Rhodopirellula sp. JB053]
MRKNLANPFSISASAPLEKGVFAEHARLRRRNFLYRVIEINHPLAGTLTYSGWWFRQTIEINGNSCWFRISWLRIQPHFEFEVPESVAIQPGWGDANDRRMKVEIHFSRTLMIRRFRIWLAGRILYDEIH